MKDIQKMHLFIRVVRINASDIHLLNNIIKERFKHYLLSILNKVVSLKSVFSWSNTKEGVYASWFFEIHGS